MIYEFIDKIVVHTPTGESGERERKKAKLEETPPTETDTQLLAKEVS